MVFGQAHPYNQVQAPYKADAQRGFGYKPPVDLDRYTRNVAQYQALTDAKQHKLSFVDNLTGGFIFRHINADKTLLKQYEKALQPMAQKGHGVVINETGTAPGLVQAPLLVDGTPASVRVVTSGSLNAIDKAIRTGKERGEVVVLRIDAGSAAEIEEAVADRMRRSVVPEVRVIRNDQVYVYTLQEAEARTYRGKIKK